MPNWCSHRTHPTSIFILAKRMIATSTKICSTSHFVQAPATCTYSYTYSPPYAIPICLRGIGMALVTRCSAIHFRGHSIRQVSYYTILSGFRLPWPPPWCEYEAAPFVVSGKRALKHLIQLLGSSPVANYAYQNGPTWNTQFAPQNRWSNVGIYTFQVWELVDCTMPPNPLVIRFTS